MKLYIVGNGFDLNHGMQTSYWHYREFLHQRYPILIRKYQESSYLSGYYCNFDTRWTDLENCMRIEYDECIGDLARNYYPDISSERTPGWEDIAIEVDNTFSFLKQFAEDCFYEWICGIKVPNEMLQRSDVDKTACFITFNYTRTLEDTYHIPDNKILHIHGSVNDFSTIQFGTPENNPETMYTMLENQYDSDDFYNVTYAPAIGKISTYASNAYKNLQANFPILRSFLVYQNMIDEIVVMGHSYMGIDELYYEKLLVPAYRNLKWTIYIHDQRDKDMALGFISKYGLKCYQLIVW